MTVAPWSAGADHVRLMVPSGLAMGTGVPGLAGAVVDVAWLDGPEAGPVPTALVAVTVKV